MDTAYSDHVRSSQSRVHTERLRGSLLVSDARVLGDMQRHHGVRIR